MADAVGFERVAQAWLKQVEQAPKDETIYRRAVQAIAFCSPETAEKMMTARRDRPGLVRLYAEAVLGLTDEGYTSGDSGRALADSRQKAFANMRPPALKAPVIRCCWNPPRGTC